MGTKTGPGGFEIDGQSHTYDSVAPGEPGLDPSPVTASDNDVNVDNEPKDLGNNTKETLADYLSDLTKGNQPNGLGPSVSNRYPIDPAPVVEGSTTDAGTGVPVPLADGTNSRRFAPNRQAYGLDTLSENYKETVKNNKSFSKGKTAGLLGDETEEFVDGNTLLSRLRLKDPGPHAVGAGSEIESPTFVKKYTKDPEPAVGAPQPGSGESWQPIIPDAEAVETLSQWTKGNYPSTAESGDGVSSAPLNGGNSFPIDADSNVTSLTTDKGYPQPFAIGDHLNSELFKRIDGSDATTHGLNLPVEQPDPIDTLQGRFNRGRSDVDAPDGHELLGKVAGDPTGVVCDYVSAVLSNNRFSDAARAAAGANLNDPARDYNPSLRHPRYGDITHHRLAQVGSALSIRAGRELFAAEPGNNPSSGAAEAEALLPGTNQLAVVKVPLQNLKTSDVLETLTGDEIDESQLKSITDGINDGSWGALNNVHDQWTGITALGMIALSIALVAGVTIVFAGLGAILGLISPGAGPVPSKTPEGRYTLGRYTVTPNVSPTALDSLTQLPPDIAALLGIRPTTFPFGAALEVGTLAFFGIEGDSFTDLASLDALDAAVTNPGWNAIVSRTIVRSSTEIINAVANIGGSPISIAKGIFNMIDVLRSSKLIAAINIFTNLGDQILTDDAEDIVSNGEVLEEPLKKSRIDKLDEEEILGAAMQKNRLRNSLKLAWSSNRAPSMYLIPDSTFTFSVVGANLGAYQTGLGLQGPKSKTFHYLQPNGNQAADGARIPYDTQNPKEPSVRKIEQLLEGEYMPFYFHDLRTNEIISFHAFLTALTDDYTPAWEQTEGFGRAEPVRIYKNTQRKISLSFFVVSTSEEDFNEMWVKINKLVTLVYPQYTQGRQLTDSTGNNKFIQPFSQLMGASPIIRLRLGDLFRSNYSRFSLARLFGADTPGAMKIGEDIKFEKGSERVQEFQKKVKDAKKTPGGPERWTSEFAKFPRKQDDGGMSISVGSAPKEPDGPPEFNVHPNDFGYFLFEIVEVLAEDDTKPRVVIKPHIPTPDELQQGWGMSPNRAGFYSSALEQAYGSRQASKARKVTDTHFVAPADVLSLSNVSLKKYYSEVFKSEIASMAALTGAEGDGFLDAKKNPLVRSFRAVQGKGLAGSLDSLGFDFYDQVLWETQKPGSKAPQFMKVNITFTPIHDIGPGLDHNGYNRAPIYPVGWFDHSRADVDNSNG